MTDPRTIQISAETIIAELRDGAFVVTVCIVGWKARAIFEPVKDFFVRVTKHMEAVEESLQTMQTDIQALTNNHIRHMEADLRTLSGRKIEDDQET